MAERKAEATFTDISGDPSRAPAEPTSKRRQHPRYLVSLEVSLGSEHNFYSGFVENLSAGGVFVATHKPAQVGEVLELELTLADLGSPIRAKGEVRWVREFSDNSDAPPGLGIRFLDLEAAADQAIHEFLSNREPIFFDDE